MSIENSTKNNRLLEKLLLKEISIKKDWQLIRIQFLETQPLFFMEYIQNGIQLTNSEEQFLVLENIGFNTNNMATLLNVLPESVHKTRYRLRKKINNSSINIVQ